MVDGDKKTCEAKILKTEQLNYYCVITKSDLKATCDVSKRTGSTLSCVWRPRQHPFNAKCVWRPPMPRPESPTWLFSQSQGHVSETARKVAELEMNNYET